MLNRFETSVEELKFYISILFLISQVSNCIDQRLTILKLEKKLLEKACSTNDRNMFNFEKNHENAKK